MKTNSGVITPIHPLGGPLEFLEELKAALSDLDIDEVDAVVDLLVGVHRAGRHVYVMGNGGSAATASHFACDLHAATRGPKRLKVTSLNDNVPLLTALANDFGYEYVFSEQLGCSVSRDDLVILLSASGDSANIVRAAHVARERGAITVGMLGFGGGQARSLVDHSIVLSNSSFGIVESVHNALAHLIASTFRSRVAGE